MPPAEQAETQEKLRKLHQKKHGAEAPCFFCGAGNTRKDQFFQERKEHQGRESSSFNRRPGLSMIMFRKTRVYSVLVSAIR